MGNSEKTLELFLKIGLDERTAKNTLANNKVTSNLTAVIDEVFSISTFFSCCWCSFGSPPIYELSNFTLIRQLSNLNVWLQKLLYLSSLRASLSKEFYGLGVVYCVIGFVFLSFLIP